MQTAKFTDMPQGSPLSLLHKLSEEHSLYDRRLETLRAKAHADGAGKAGRGPLEEDEVAAEG